MCRRAQSYLLPDIHLVCLPHPNLENCVVSIKVLVKYMVKLKSRTEKTVSQLHIPNTLLKIQSGDDRQ